MHIPAKLTLLQYGTTLALTITISSALCDLHGSLAWSAVPLDRNELSFSVSSSVRHSLELQLDGGFEGGGEDNIGIRESYVKNRYTDVVL